MAATATVIDTFPGASFNGTTWFTFNAQTTCSNGCLITHPSANTTYTGLGTNSNFSLVGSYAITCLTSAGNQALASLEVYPVQLYAGTGTDTNQQVAFLLTQNSLSALYDNGTSQTITGSVTYNSGLHRYFRIAESGGTTTWTTSPDGQHWNAFFSVANPFAPSAVAIQLRAGTYASEATGTTVTWSSVGGFGPVYHPKPQVAAIKRAAYF